jgi:AcrR family transcriptional regulator
MFRPKGEITTMKNSPKNPSSAKTRRLRGGRPNQARAAQIERHLLEAATKLFLADGYGVTGMEAIAKRAGIAKRTLYLRYRDKADLFLAVVRHVVDRLRPANTEDFFKGKNLEETLHKLGQLILRASLSPDALALQRLILAEAARFPELAATVHKVGARDEAVHRIKGLLEQESKSGHLTLNAAEAAFAAEQFLMMLTAGPQRRTLVAGTPMTEDDMKAWVKDTVRLFLNGCRTSAAD